MALLIQTPRNDYARAYYRDALHDPDVLVTTHRLDQGMLRRLVHLAPRAIRAEMPAAPLGALIEIERVRRSVDVLLIHEWAEGSRDSDYASRLRRRFPNSYLVFFYSNPVALQGLSVLRRLKESYDLIVSFDPEDAKKYGLIYHPIVIGSIAASESPPDVGPIDLFFVGRAKGRAQMLVELHEAVTNAGGCADFTILEAGAEVMRRANGVNWDQRLDYPEVIQRVMRSHSLLDITAVGQTGFTLRVWESLIYGRRLLTNNPDVATLPFRDGQMVYFRDIRDIDVSVLMRPAESSWSAVELPYSSYSLLDAIRRNLY